MADRGRSIVRPVQNEAIGKPETRLKPDVKFSSFLRRGSGGVRGANFANVQRLVTRRGRA